MIAAGAQKLCFVISPGKTDIIQYYGAGLWGADIAYVVQPSPLGLCDAVFRAAPFIAEHDSVLIGLPDTIWTPADGFAQLPTDVLSFLLFPVEHPEFFDAVLLDEHDAVQAIDVKQKLVRSHWIWGGIRMPGQVFHALHRLWCQPARRDEYLGTLVNAFLVQGGRAIGVRCGQAYVDVGTLNGYREALRFLGEHAQPPIHPLKEQP